jgi:trans-L-3-hydroxyproline dehydratase
MKAGKVVSSSFLNVPSFVLKQNDTIDVAGIGSINIDIAYGGAFYVICQAEELDLSLTPSNYFSLVDYGKKIKKAIIEKINIRHPFEDDLSFLYGTIFTGKAKSKEHHSRNVCIFADGELDRSPTGSGISARAALHYAKGELNKGERITVESILGTTMDVCISDITQYGPFEAVIPEVSGQSYFTGRNEFWFDPEDPLKNGFIFR